MARPAWPYRYLQRALPALAAMLLSACNPMGNTASDETELQSTNWSYREAIDPLTDDQLSFASRVVRSGNYAFEVEFSCRNRRLALYTIAALDRAGEAVPLHVQPDYLTGADMASATVRADLRPARTADYVLDRFNNVILLSAANLDRQGMIDVMRARTVTIGLKLATADAIFEIDQADSGIQRALTRCARAAAEPQPVQPLPEAAEDRRATSPTPTASPAPVAPQPAPLQPAPRPVPTPQASRHTATHAETPRHVASPRAAARPTPAAPTVRSSAAPHPTAPRHAGQATHGEAARANVASAPASPSFSCRARLTRVESLICADAELARLDRRMSALYGQLRANRGLREQVLRDQRLFLADVAQCGTARCVDSAYRERIDELSDY